MRKLSFLLLSAAIIMMTACSKDDESSNSGSSSASGSSSDSSSALSNVTGTTNAYNMDISFDTSSISESESIPTDSTLEEYNDYIENDEDYSAGWANTFTITYSDGSVSIDGYDESDTDFIFTADGAHLTVTAQKKAHYILSGSASDGSFTIDSSSAEKKAWITLNGLTLTSSTGAVISKDIDKRLYLEIASGTTNTLVDGTTTDHDATIFSQGKLAISGSGALLVTANYKNCIHCKDYIRLRKLTNLTLTASANNAIKASDSIVVEGGNLYATVGSSANNGLSADLLIKINGGVQNISVASSAGKGISSDGDVVVNGGRTTIITTGGGAWDSDESSATASAGVKADATFTINGGALYAKSTGAGGKAISADGNAYFNGGVVYAMATGSSYSYNSDSCSPKGVKIDGNITVAGSTIIAQSLKSETIETKGTFTITSGYIDTYGSDDCINSSGNMYLNGGYVGAYSTSNDALDANGDMYVNGATVHAICAAGGAETALDANTEGGHQLYVQSGTLVAYPSLENGASLTQACYQLSISSTSTWNALYNGSSLALVFKAAKTGTYVVSTPSTSLYTGVSVSDGTSAFCGLAYINATLSSTGSSASLSTYSGGTGMGGGMPGGGGMSGRPF